MERMNVLMVMADQLPASALGAYGHRVVRTPHLDALASRGALFQNCYCNNPLCVPSRASMVTGRLSGRIASFDNGCELPASIPTFMHHLRLGGYRTILSGKMHFIGPDQLHGIEERLTTDIYPSGFNWTPDWRRGVYGNPGASVRQLRKSGLCKSGLQLDYDEEVHFRALERLRKLGRERDHKPFFLCVSYTHPHDPFIITPPYWDLYKDSDVEDPAAPAQPGARKASAPPLEAMHPFNQWIQIHHEVDKYPPSPEDIRRTLPAFYGMVSYLDEKVGGLLGELARLGLSETTIVLFASDHGEMMGEHGMWFKRTFYEDAARVPLIVARPGAPSGRRIREVVSLVDLFPTLLDLAGLPVPDGLDGHSVAGALGAGLKDWGDSAIIEYLGEGAVRPMRALRRGRFKYVYVDDNPPLLFDLEADPHELCNLAGQANLAAAEAGLRATLLQDWDPKATTESILRSQQERLLLREALGVGRKHPWDFQPSFDASKQYVREQDAQATSLREIG